MSHEHLFLFYGLIKRTNHLRHRMKKHKQEDLVKILRKRRESMKKMQAIMQSERSATFVVADCLSQLAADKYLSSHATNTVWGK